MCGFRLLHIVVDIYTLPETNIAPQNGWLEDEFPFGMAQFQGLCYFQGMYIYILIYIYILFFYRTRTRCVSWRPRHVPKDGIFPCRLSWPSMVLSTFLQHCGRRWKIRELCRSVLVVFKTNIYIYIYMIYMAVAQNNGTPKSSNCS